MIVYQWLANATLLLHIGVVLFIVGGLLLVPLGHFLRWRWVDSVRFRLAHLAVLGYVVVQTWLGEVCPLTTLESWLRNKAGERGYSGGFIAHWLQRLLYYDAPLWVFALAYTAFGLLVVAAWKVFPPRRRTTR